QHVAVEGFIDYMLVNFWAGNTDWPRHNWYAVKRRQPLSRWRFVSWDAEHVLEKISDDATGPKWWSTDNTPGELFEAMLDNDGFRDQLAERANELLGAGGLLSSEPEAVARGMYAGLTEQIVDAVVLESARWGDYHRADEPYTRDVEWSAEVAWILDDWFAERPAVVAEQLEELDLDVELDRDDADDTPD
ncbi:MAG: hypothetical protein GY884_19720, partial [Proteobacteria bacterium]|nr:hypothetical protein [Pseudomonadota bacterium]